MQSNTTTRIVNALSYLSILFLPVIFPLIVWIVARASDDPTISKNARKAFWSQLFPLLYVIFAILTMSLVPGNLLCRRPVWNPADLCPADRSVVVHLQHRYGS